MTEHSKGIDRILWCAEPGCRVHVHFGPGQMHALPDGWRYEQRRRGLVPICGAHYFGGGVPKEDSTDGDAQARQRIREVGQSI